MNESEMNSNHEIIVAVCNNPARFEKHRIWVDVKIVRRSRFHSSILSQPFFEKGRLRGKSHYSRVYEVCSRYGRLVDSGHQILTRPSTSAEILQRPQTHRPFVVLLPSLFLEHPAVACIPPLTAHLKTLASLLSNKTTAQRRDTRLETSSTTRTALLLLHGRRLLVLHLLGRVLLWWRVAHLLLGWVVLAWWGCVVSVKECE